MLNEGWQRKFTVEMEKVDEYVKMYENIGFEPAEEGDTGVGCTTCFTGSKGKYVIIFTRAKKGS